MNEEVVDSYYMFLEYGLQLVQVLGVNCAVDYINGKPHIRTSRNFVPPLITKYATHKKMVIDEPH